MCLTDLQQYFKNLTEIWIKKYNFDQGIKYTNYNKFGKENPYSVTLKKIESNVKIFNKEKIKLSSLHSAVCERGTRNFKLRHFWRNDFFHYFAKNVILKEISIWTFHIFYDWFKRQSSFIDHKCHILKKMYEKSKIGF